MNDFLTKAIVTKHDRRPAFDIALSSLKDEPANILVIGAERAEVPESIFGDGFFSLYAAMYVEKHGGKLTIVDIDPLAMQRCMAIMSDFVGKIDLNILSGDGINWIDNCNWDLIYLDGDDDPNSMYEQFKKVDRTTTAILADDWHGKGLRIRKDFQDFELLKCNYIHEMAFYPKIEGNLESFKIGEITMPYVRERPNMAWYNERSMELGLGKYFSEKFNGDIVEIGDVSYQYSYFKDWPVIDCAPVYSKAIRKSVLDPDVDLTGKNVLSISTIEHVGEGSYNDGVQDLGLACDALSKIAKQAKNYLITFPIGANRKLEMWSRAFPYTIMKRVEQRGSVNNWVEDRDHKHFRKTYGHFGYGLSYYGNALYVVVVSNIPEIVS